LLPSLYSYGIELRKHSFFPLLAARLLQMSYAVSAVLCIVVLGECQSWVIYLRSGLIDIWLNLLHMRREVSVVMGPHVRNDIVADLQIRFAELWCTIRDLGDRGWTSE